MSASQSSMSGAGEPGVRLTAEGITVQSFNADLLYEPWEVLDDDGCPFTMFAPFWNRCLCMPDPAAPLLPPKRINSGDLSRCPWDELIFEDESERGSNALLARAWSPGWKNADKALTAFLNGPLMDYSVNRKRADSISTSLLSALAKRMSYENREMFLIF